MEGAVADAVRVASAQSRVDAYVIGGFVRDKILGRPTKDMDIVAIGDGIRLAKEVAKQLGLPKPVIYSRFGTAMLDFDGLEVEFVGARKESYRADSRNPVVEAGTLEDDQNRRDFTINAMAVCLSEDRFSEFLDPFEGLSDIDRRIIRTPTDPDKTFSDDPLRMMRAVRFASQLGYEIEEETFKGIQRNVSRIDIISQERITSEMNKIMLSPRPSVGWKLLMDTGLCELVAPEMYQLRGVDYVGSRGHKDNFYHTLEVLDNVSLESDDLWLRYAALLHDIGKPRTKRWDDRAGWTFHGHDAVGSYMVPKIFRKMKLPMGAEMNYVKKLVLLHLRPISLTNKNISDSAIRRLLFEAGDDIDDLMTLCQADITTKNKGKMQRYLANYELVKSKMIELEESDRLRNWQPPISGEHIMDTFGIKPSRTVGDIKTAIREAILDGEIPNEFQAAHQYMLGLGAELGLGVDTELGSSAID
ncbi:MAG: HD domain-containing protein [Bacteroidota bacterium]